MLWDDVRFALRSYRKNPGFTLVAVLTIALGLGANTAIFSFLDGVLLKPVSYPEPERIVQLWEKPPGGTRNVISAANFLDWQKQNTVFQMIAASSGKTVTLSGGGEPRQLRVGLVSAPYFDIFGVRPSLGRAFANGEDLPGKDRVAVLSHRIWQSSFGSDTGILGRDLTLDGESYTIIGVLPGDNEFDRGWPDIWLPLAFKPETATRNFHYLTAVARLKPGTSLEQARAEMSAIAALIAEHVTAQRTQELGVRAALGASSWDLIRLVVGGGTVPVAAGLVVGVIGALALTRLVQGLLFETSPTDPVTMVWVGSVLLLVALTACYLPARRAARVDAMTALRYE